MNRATYPDLRVSLLHGLQSDERPALAVHFVGLVIPAVVLVVVQGLVMDEYIRLQSKKLFYYVIYSCHGESKVVKMIFKGSTTVYLLHRSVL